MSTCVPVSIFATPPSLGLSYPSGRLSPTHLLLFLPLQPLPLQPLPHQPLPHQPLPLQLLPHQSLLLQPLVSPAHHPPLPYSLSRLPTKMHCIGLLL